MDDKETAKAARDIEAHLAAADLAIFPTVFEDADLHWPDHDWQAFLEVAVKAGAQVIYWEQTEVPGEDVAKVQELASDLGEDERRALADAATWNGPVRLELGFIVGGLRHRWSTEADWLATFDDLYMAVLRSGTDDSDESDELVSLLSDRKDLDDRRATEAARLAPVVQEWIARLASEPSVLAARNQAARLAAARDLIPELEEWRAERYAWDNPEGEARRDAVFAVRRQLEEAVTAVKEQREAEARAELDAWAQDLAATPDYRQATTQEMRRRAASAFVTGRLGFISTDLRDRLVNALRV